MKRKTYMIQQSCCYVCGIGSDQVIKVRQKSVERKVLQFPLFLGKMQRDGGRGSEMSVGGVEQRQSTSVLKRPFIRDSMRYSILCFGIFSLQRHRLLFFISFSYNFYLLRLCIIRTGSFCFAVIILLLSKNSCFTIIISSCFVLVVDHELCLDIRSFLMYFYNIRIFTIQYNHQIPTPWHVIQADISFKSQYSQNRGYKLV